MDLSWKLILSISPSILCLCLGGTYDALASFSNLHRGNITTETSCKLCHKQICTTAHVLGACKFPLQQGRFTFRHASVLQVLVSVLQSFLSSYTISKSNCNTTTKFVKAGSKLQKSGWPVTIHTRLEITVWPQQQVGHSLIYSSKSVKTRCCSFFAFYQNCDHFWNSLVLVRKTWRSGIIKNMKNTILCLWQWFPIVGQCIKIGTKGYCSTNVNYKIDWGFLLITP